MKHMRLRFQLIIVSVLLLSGTGITMAQQDPVYSQYLNNPLLINPAFAGNNNMFNATLQYRTQWAGLDNNPTTVNFNAHMSMYENKLGVGLLVSQDQLGDTKNNEMNAVGSYRLPIGKTSTLSFGMQMGFVRYTNDPSLLRIRDPGDPAFLSMSETKFNTGAGLLLKGDRFLVGISIPRLIPVSISQGGTNIQLYNNTFYGMGAYLVRVNENLYLRPSVLLRGTSGTPLSADINASLVFYRFYTAGLFTRNFKSYGLLTQALIKNFRIGYVFELPGSSTSSLNFTSHEIMIGWTGALLKGHDLVPKSF